MLAIEDLRKERIQGRGSLGDEQTSPFARAKTRKILSPSIFFEVTSEATQPSVASGCHAFVPTS
jgi:hypothetical protein